MADFENPFTPTFGEIPAHLAGRHQIVSDTERALKSERRRPELSAVYSGARGSGKTTLLALLANRAESLGWVSANVTAVPGMLEDIEIQSRRRAAHLLDGDRAPRVSKVGIPQLLEVSIEKSEMGQANWRARMEDVVEQLQAKGSGLLITVDEVDGELDEMVQLVSVYQHFVREGRRVALLMAGLPHNVSAFISNKSVSFVRKAQVVKLERIADHDVAVALRKTVDDAGRSIDAEGVDLAARAIGGFPFLIQLVGFRAWDEHPGEDAISTRDVLAGIEAAKQDMRARILDPTYRELSAGDISFLKAMLADEGDSAIRDITARLGKSSSLVAQYRRRLIDAGVIGGRRRGVIGFDLPYFKEYLAGELGLGS